MLQGLLYEEESFSVFIFITVLLGGGAAYLSGRAIAQTWRPWWSVIVYMMMLGIFIRFVHFALFQSTLLSLHFYLADTAIAIIFGFLGYWATRQRQMIRQYGFLTTGPGAPMSRE